ncbi:MAG: hypothetical protein DRI23_08225 [Candidatus Cloacimonadota bacterium]|nr:MAG: hypothetical protein DRI23_08225 [Candidatus Cloacimonadota bacterium]
MKYLIIALLVIILWGCSGEDVVNVDSIPPAKPDLIHHLGDTGDGGTSSYPGANYYNLSSQPELENNGIDADDEGDFIQLKWWNLPDTDIDYLEIFRFTLQDFQNDSLDFVTKIDSIDYNNQTQYLDMNAPIFKNLFYFISVVDEAGNYTYSDTVCYKLLHQPSVLGPPSEITVSPQVMNQTEFSWWEDESGTVIMYRLLLFDENRNLIWQYEPLDLEDPSVIYNGPNIDSGTTVTWRLDAFGHDLFNVEIFDQEFTVHSGSESAERVLYVQ